VQCLWSCLIILLLNSWPVGKSTFCAILPLRDVRLAHDACNAFGVRSLRIIATENGDCRLGFRLSFRWSPWSFSVVVLMRTSMNK
jgi:hypothetical protein